MIVATGVRAGAASTLLEPAPRQPAPAPFEPIEILTSAFRDEKKDVEWQRPAPLDRHPGQRRRGELRYEAISTLKLQPGVYELRVAARHEQAGAVGSVHTYVDVPDFDHESLTLSGVVLFDAARQPRHRRRRWRGILDTAPTTRREFSSGDEVSALVRVYQRQREQPAPIAVSFRVLDSGLAEVATAPSPLQSGQFTGTGSADARYRLPLGSLRPGSYVLRVEATRERTTARRDVRFEVR